MQDRDGDRGEVAESDPVAGQPRIVAVVPALNEALSIEKVVSGLLRQTHVPLAEIIVVDNRSTDDTAALARAAGARVVSEPRRGYGQACWAGVLAAEDADVVVLLDGDAADEPEDLPRVLGPLLEGHADLVVGSRALGSREPGSMTPHQVFGNWLAATIMRTLYGIAVTDMGPFRTIRRADLLALDMREMTYGWSVEMMVKAARAGLRYHEVPVSYRRRIGLSKVAGTVRGSVLAGWCILATTFRVRALDAASRGTSGSGRLTMTDVLYVAARAPRPGFAKTRLGKALGHEPANLLYAAFLQDLAARLAAAPFSVGWYVTPEDAWDDLHELVAPSLAPEAPPGPVLVQGPGDWATRQQTLFDGAPARGERRTILIASDSPHITLDPLTEAFALLDQHDLVLGPVDDGGYYLIGMRGPYEVLGGVPMSTRTVLDEIVARAQAQGLSVGFVEPTFDVDEAADLARLAELAATRDDLPATRRALAGVLLSTSRPGAHI